MSMLSWAIWLWRKLNKIVFSIYFGFRIKYDPFWPWHFDFGFVMYCADKLVKIFANYALKTETLGYFAVCSLEINILLVLDF